MPESLRENHEQHGEQQQDAAEVDRERIVNQHAGEQFVARRVADRSQVLPRCGKPQSDGRADQRDPKRIDLVQPAEHAQQQHEHDRGAQRQLRPKQRQAGVGVIATRASDELANNSRTNLVSDLITVRLACQTIRTWTFAVGTRLLISLALPLWPRALASFTSLRPIGQALSACLIDRRRHVAQAAPADTRRTEWQTPTAARRWQIRAA